MSHTYPQRRGYTRKQSKFSISPRRNVGAEIAKQRVTGKRRKKVKRKKKKKRERKEKEGSRDPDLVAREKSTRLTASVRQNFSPSPPISPPCVPSPGKKKNRRLTGRAPLETAEREKERKKEGGKREGNVRRN